MGIIIMFAIIFGIVVLGSIKQIDEYEKGIKFTRGKYSKTLNSGWHVIWPIFQSLKKIDINTMTPVEAMNLLFELNNRLK